MLPKKLAGLALVVSGLVIQAFALPFSGLVTGSWMDVISDHPYDVFTTSDDDAASTADFNWGIAARGSTDNQFMFDGASFTDVEENTPFSIGTFEYRNGSTYNSIGINGVSLSLDLELTDPVEVEDNFDFDFSITNTPNVYYDPERNADIVNVMNSISPTAFTVSGMDYSLNLLGFSSDGGTTVRTNFSSLENATQRAQLFARITPHTQSVPEPGTTSLLLMGVLTLGGAVLSRKKN